MYEKINNGLPFFCNSRRFLLNTILIFFVIYNVRYFFFPYGLPSQYFVLFFLLALQGWTLVNNRRHLFFCDATILGTGFLFLSVVILSWLCNGGSGDFYMIKISLMYLIIAIATYYIINGLFHGDKLSVLKCIGVIGSINGLLVVAMLLSKKIQYGYLSLIDLSAFELIGGLDVLSGPMSLRMVGATGFSAYTTGFTQVLCLMSYIIYINYREPSNKLNTKDYFVLILNVLSAIIAARSSFVGVFFVVLIFLKFSFAKNLWRIICMSLLAFAMLLVIINFMSDSFRGFFSSWVFELFNSGIQTGSLRTNLSMFVYSLSDFSLTGDARWYGDDNNYYMNTDVGWYRLLFSNGLLGLIAWCTWVMAIIGYDNLFSFKIKNENILAFLLLIYVFIMMFKGAILFDNFQSTFIITVIGSFLRDMRLNNAP